MDAVDLTLSRLLVEPKSNPTLETPKLITMKSFVLLFGLILFIAGFEAAKKVSRIPVEWKRQIEKFDAFYSENDDGETNAEGYPGIYMPLMRSDYFLHSKGVRSDTYFFAGVYNNETTSPSIRARVPATMFRWKILGF